MHLLNEIATSADGPSTVQSEYLCTVVETPAGNHNNKDLTALKAINHCHQMFPEMQKQMCQEKETTMPLFYPQSKHQQQQLNLRGYVNVRDQRSNGCERSTLRSTIGSERPIGITFSTSSYSTEPRTSRGTMQETATSALLTPETAKAIECWFQAIGVFDNNEDSMKTSKSSTFHQQIDGVVKNDGKKENTECCYNSYVKSGSISAERIGDENDSGIANASVAEISNHHPKSYSSAKISEVGKKNPLIPMATGKLDGLIKCAVCEQQREKLTRCRKKKIEMKSSDDEDTAGSQQGDRRQQSKYKRRKKFFALQDRNFCCKDCLDFFSNVVLIPNKPVRECTEASASTIDINKNQFCPIPTKHVSLQSEILRKQLFQEEKTSSKDWCEQCRLDRCILAGMTARFVFDRTRRPPKKSQRCMQRLDEWFALRRQTLEERQKSSSATGSGYTVAEIVAFRSNDVDRASNRTISCTNGIMSIDVAMLDFGVIKSMLHVNAQWARWRSVSQPKDFLPLFHGLSIGEMLSGTPLLLGTGALAGGGSSSKEGLEQQEHALRDAQFTPTSAHVSIDHLFMDFFLVFELWRTTPVMCLLDKDDMNIHLAYIPLALTLFSQYVCALTVRSETLLFPDGHAPLKYWLNQMRPGRQRFTLHDSTGTLMQIDGEISEHQSIFLSRLAIHLYHGLMQPFLRTQPTAIEFVLLRALIFSWPKTPGISKHARLLLEVEQEKCSKILYNHLLREFGSTEAAKERHSHLMELVKLSFTAARLRRRLRSQFQRCVLGNGDDDVEKDDENYSLAMENKVEVSSAYLRRSWPQFMYTCIGQQFDDDQTEEKDIS